MELIEKMRLRNIPGADEVVKNHPISFARFLPYIPLTMILFSNYNEAKYLFRTPKGTE